MSNPPETECSAMEKLVEQMTRVLDQGTHLADAASTLMYEMTELHRVCKGSVKEDIFNKDQMQRVEERMSDLNLAIYEFRTRREEIVKH